MKSGISSTDQGITSLIQFRAQLTEPNSIGSHELTWKEDVAGKFGVRFAFSVAIAMQYKVLHITGKREDTIGPCLQAILAR